ncbi:HNH endonuclease [Gottfriedia luciferensis]|uniref:HNH endonuclease n=1 Tax=Gottfriedia luciferensis TaxID=178774 RepID=UPI0011552352|nr:HNH endonuclease [Gottfriedia luciferensis]
MERIRKYGYRNSTSVNISVEEIEVLLQQRNCSYCGCELNGEQGHTQQATIDHTYGGINLASTLTVCCRSCNSAKGRKHVFEFYQDSEKFTDELWSKFVRDFTSKLISRDISAEEVEEMKVRFENEFNALGELRS